MKIVTEQIIEALQSYNEAEIRFYIIDPTLRKLGYPGGNDVYLHLEERLEYPYYHIGHKSSKKDVPLGYPDYRAGLKGQRGSFIVEAKAATVLTSDKDVEQAHSYAAHAQVGANYFVLCDGQNFAVYETLSGPKHTPIVTIPIVDLDDRFHELENILSPSYLAKNCHISHDLNLKLCDGLGSSAKIQTGEYNMDSWAYRILLNGDDCTELVKNSVPQIADLDNQLATLEREFELRVADGIAARDIDGRINAEVSFSGVTKNNREAMELLGIDKMIFSTKEKFLSNDQHSPTVFETTADFSLKRGTMVPPLFGDAIPAQTDMKGDLFISARMYKNGDTMLGEYAAFSEYQMDLPDIGIMKLEFEFFGHFSLKLVT